MSIPINIEDLLHKRKIESNRIEFKRGWNPDKIYRTICAFANDFDNIGGGYIVVGVEEENGIAKRPVTGIPVESLDKIQKEIIGFNNKIEPYYMPRLDVQEVDGQYVLTASNVNEPVSYEWYDINENLVGKGQNIKMPIEKYGQYKLRVIADKDGAVSYANINVASVMNIEAAAFTQTTGGDVNIKLSMPATDKTKVKITSVANPMYTREIKVRECETQVQADVTGCPKGVYMVSLEENGVTMDTKRIINE